MLDDFSSKGPGVRSKMPPKNIIINQRIKPQKLLQAKKLRQEMTPAEQILWAHLRNNRLEGFHFRRQQIITPYIVDFYCHQASLIVEVDGGIHSEQQEYDRARDEYLQSHGLHVLRFTNSDISSGLETVLGEIYRICQERLLPASRR